MRRSDWEFQTSNNTSAGYAFVTAGRGEIWLKKKDDGTTAYYWYVSAGASLGVAPFSLSGSTKDMWNTGAVYILPAFSGSELGPGDFAGMCMILDAAATAGIGDWSGGSGAVMLVGASQTDLATELAYAGNSWQPPQQQVLDLLTDSDGFDVPRFILAHANAVILIAGMSKGSPSASLSGSLGYLRLPSDGVGSTNTPKLPPPPPEDLAIRTSSQGREEGPPIVLPGDALFDFNKWDLKPEAISKLTDAKLVILRNLGKPVLVEGYTDGIGSVEYNLALSKWRAEAVKTWLTANGVPNPIYTAGYGRDRRYAVASNTTPEGRKRNRRVQVKIMQSTWRPR